MISVSGVAYLRRREGGREHEQDKKRARACACVIYFTCIPLLALWDTKLGGRESFRRVVSSRRAKKGWSLASQETSVGNRERVQLVSISLLC